MNNNREIAKIFHGIANYLAMDDIPFKPQAYEKAALNLESLEKDVSQIYQEGGEDTIEKIPGIGKSMAQKIIEYLKTGRIKEYEAMKKKMPVEINELQKVEGIGPKIIRDLYKNLKIKNIDDLEKAAKNGKIRDLKNFGLKTEQNILESIKFLKRSKGRFLLGEILPKVEEIVDKLKKLKEVKKISPAGSTRRMKETIGDVDILITTDCPEKIMDYFTSLNGIEKIWGKGKTKSSVRMEDGFDIDLRVVPEKSFGSALQYFTGSKEHNIALRIIAQNKNCKLNEYGLFQNQKSKIKNQNDKLKFKNINKTTNWIQIAGENEKEVYNKLGLNWIPPEMRENRGEIELALRQAQGKPNKLPELIGYDEITGDLHVHSNWDGGENSIEELAEAARKIGYEYIGIADHTKYLKIEHGLDEKQLEKRNKEIDGLNHKSQITNHKFIILKGCEANIMKDGAIDINNETLSKLDYVIAGIHSHFKMSKGEMTNRLIKTMENPNVDIISHPTGRLLQERDEYEIDLDKILKKAGETGTILEINSYPQRLDLNDINIKKAVAFKVKLIINTDAHEKFHLHFMKYGVSQARRGWAEKKNIINAWPLEKLMKQFK